MDIQAAPSEPSDVGLLRSSARVRREQSPNRILLVVDDGAGLGMLRDSFVTHGFQVSAVADRSQVMGALVEQNPDLVVLESGLGRKSGLEVVREVRQASSVPVIVLSSGGQDEMLRGFELGADDWLAMPVDLREVLARVRAVLRRVQPAAVRSIVLGTVRIDFGSRSALRGTRRIHLTSREFEMLRYLGERAGQVVGRDDLLRSVWGYGQPPFTRSVDHAVARLRKKLERDPAEPQFIHTVRGDGYCLTPTRRS